MGDKAGGGGSLYPTLHAGCALAEQRYPEGANYPARVTLWRKTSKACCVDQLFTSKVLLGLHLPGRITDLSSEVLQIYH